MKPLRLVLGVALLGSWPAAALGQSETRLPAGGGEPGGAYLALVKAIQASDFAAVRKYLPAGEVPLPPPTGADLQLFFRGLVLNYPRSAEVTGGVIKGDEAMVEIAGIDDEQKKIKGRIAMKKSDGEWRVLDQMLFFTELDRGSPTPETPPAPPSTPTPTRAAAPAQPAEPFGEGAVRVGGVIKAPQKMKDVPPVYPAGLGASGPRGTVILEAVVEQSGRVGQIQVLRSVDGLDDAAIAAVKQWMYAPTLVSGVPTRVIITIPVTLAPPR